MNFQKGEQIVWAFPGADYLEDKTKRQYVGGSQGVSIRVMKKAVYYRVGAFKGSLSNVPNVFTWTPDGQHLQRSISILMVLLGVVTFPIPKWCHSSRSTMELVLSEMPRTPNFRYSHRRWLVFLQPCDKPRAAMM